MGIINTKDFLTNKKIDECTSNTSLSNLRYVVTEKPKWKYFKKKEIVALPRPVKGCPCGNDGPCKQKVTPNGVTIHYPQKKRKYLCAFGTERRYKPPKIQKSYFNRFKKSLSSAIPFQTRITTSMHFSLPALTLNNAFKAIKSIKKPSLPSSLNMSKISNAMKSLKSMNPIKKKPRRHLSRDFMFMSFMQ